MIWLLATAHAASTSFFPGTSDGVAVYEGDATEGTVDGVRVARSGALVVRAADLAALRAMPEVAAVVPLRGQVARIVVRRGVDEIELARRLHGMPEPGGLMN